MSDGILITFVLLGLLALIALAAAGIYNRLVRSQVRTREAWSGIDVQLRRRTSLIPNLVEVVQGDVHGTGKVQQRVGFFEGRSRWEGLG